MRPDPKVSKVSPDKNDSRRRLIAITKQGEAKLAEANELLAADGQTCFNDWPTKDLEGFRNHLAALTTWLDENRL